MVDHEYDLLGKEPWVDGVQDISCSADRVIAFEMTVVVPGQRRDPVTV